MTNSDMFFVAKAAVVNYFNENSVDVQINADNVYVVWFSKTLQHFKALLSTELNDGMYYEVTYNGDTHQAYLDAYKFWQNKVFTINGDEEVPPVQTPEDLQALPEEPVEEVVKEEKPTKKAKKND